MTKFQFFLLLVSLLLSVWASLRSSNVVKSYSVVEVITNNVEKVSVSAPSVASVASSTGSVLVLRGSFQYHSREKTHGEYVVFSNGCFFAGSPCEYGWVTSVSSRMVEGLTFDGGMFYLLPEYVAPSVKGGEVVITRVEANTRHALHFKRGAVFALPC